MSVLAIKVEIKKMDDLIVGQLKMTINTKSWEPILSFVTRDIVTSRVAKELEIMAKFGL